MANGATAHWEQDEHLFFEGKTNEEIVALTGRGAEAVARKRRRLISTGSLAADPQGAVEQSKQKLRDDHARRLQATRIREEAQLELLAEAIRAAASRIPYREPEFARPGTYHFEEEEAVLLLGDLQVGQTVDLVSTGELGHFNFDVFQTRLQTLQMKVERITKGHQSYLPLRTLNIFGLGDFVEGMTIYPGQLNHIDLDLVDQVFLGSAQVAELVVYLLGVYEHINLFGVLGNHGRIGRKGELPTTANLDYMFLRHLEIQLEEFIKAGRVTCEFPKTFFQVVERQNHRFFLVHGDDIRGWMSLPWYGAQRAVQRWQELVRERFDYFIFGHHHTTAQWEANYKEVLANGSFVGTNEYSAKQLNIGGRPSQVFFGLHPRIGITWRYRIMLDEGEPQRSVPVYRGAGA